MITYYGKAILTENFSYFCSINVLNFSHKLTLKTVDIAYKSIKMSLKRYKLYFQKFLTTIYFEKFLEKLKNSIFVF